MDVLYLSHIAILLAAPPLLVGVAYWVYANRDHDSVPAFVFVLLTSACWGLMSIGETAAPAIEQKYLFLQFRYVFGWGFSIGVLWFALAFTDRDQYIDRRLGAAVAVTLAVALTAIFTDPIHGLIWPDYRIAEPPFGHLVTDRGTAFWRTRSRTRIAAAGWRSSSSRRSSPGAPAGGSRW